MKVERWGDCLAVRSPSTTVQALGLKEGDDIDIHVTRHERFDAGREASREELVARLRILRGRLPQDFKFDRDEADAR